MDYKAQIIEKLQSFKREGMTDLIAWLEKTDYFTSPASSKYHSNYIGGLAEHSWKVSEVFAEKNTRYNLGLSDETVWICGLLHDVCKCNYYKRGLKNVKSGKKINGYGKEVDNWIEKEVWETDDQLPIGHGAKSVILVQRFISMSEFEVTAIMHHMGLPDGYLEKMTYSAATKKHPGIVALHTSDYESSYLLEKIIED
jgi:hypothetical protein